MIESSIIITAYNREDFIGAAIGSALAQSDCGEIEVIVVDDCSVDATRCVVEEYSCLDSRLRVVFHESNLGVLEATLTGLRLARGRYIFLLDSDDLMHSRRVARCVQYFEENTSTSIIVHGIEAFEEFSDIADKMKGGFNKQFSRYGGCARSMKLDEEYFRTGPYVAIHSERANIEEFVRECCRMFTVEERMRSYQDLPICYYSAFRGVGEAAWVPDILYFRRHHSNNSGATPTLERATANAERGVMTISVTKRLIGEYISPNIGRILDLKMARAQFILGLYKEDFRSARDILFSNMIYNYSYRSRLLLKLRYCLFWFLGARRALVLKQLVARFK
ncbi:glycosyltransferase family 2 protein [Amorphus sp. 3PC139-8]|uniref:glycosyltransferase family 2 protein n=1 Tax=Amorphus sp. 3PC139-8 TaxID=2735676 RepID=UPI00345E0038